jgi:hypothetical protein
MEHYTDLQDIAQVLGLTMNGQKKDILAYISMPTPLIQHTVSISRINHIATA